MEAEGQSGGGGRRPQAVPGGIAGVEVERVDDGPAVTEAGAPLELRRRRLG